MMPDKDETVENTDENVSDPSLHDEIAHAFKEVREKEASDTGEKPKVEPGEKTRDETGKFVKQEAKQEQSKDAKTAPASNAPSAEPVEATPSALKAPEGWSTQAKADFGKLPPHIQQEVVRREAEAHKKITSQDSDREFGRKIKEISLPYQAIMQAEGATHEAAYQDYLNTAFVLRTGTPQAKAMALQTIARQFNVPLGVPLQQPGYNPEIETLSQRLTQFEQAQQANAYQRQVQEQSALQSEIEAFGASADHEHFQNTQVRTLMGSLLESGQANDLQAAYEKAIWAIPELRSTLLEQDRLKSEEKRKAEMNLKTENAKRASGSVTGGPGGAKPNGSQGTERSLDEEIRANMRSVQGRV